jgi:hypothetical protein
MMMMGVPLILLLKPSCKLDRDFTLINPLIRPHGERDSV